MMTILLFKLFEIYSADQIAEGDARHVVVAPTRFSHEELALKNSQPSLASPRHSKKESGPLIFGRKNLEKHKRPAPASIKAKRLKRMPDTEQRVPNERGI